MDLILGFDPGGAKGRKFGWAVAEDNRSLPLQVRITGVASHAGGAVQAAQAHVQSEDRVIAAGIDSPLYWTATGDRKADLRIRDHIRRRGAGSSAGGTVQHPNSLQGACVVQGPTAALLLRRALPNLPLTESHPKAMLWALGVASFARKPPDITTRDLGELVIGSIGAPEDERDAVLGALAAWAMANRPQGWSDLVALELDPLFFTSEKVSYWFPIAG